MVTNTGKQIVQQFKFTH